MKTERRLDRAQQFRVGLVQPEPNDAALAPRKRAQFLNGNIPHVLAISVEGAGDHTGSSRYCCGFGADQVEDFSQRFSPVGRVRWVRVARCRGRRGSGWS